MTARLVVASHNRHKVAEVAEILGDLGVPLLSLADYAPFPPAQEDGGTFAENAARKALHTSRRLPGEAVLADDSGLCVDALDGEPGIHSARYAGPGADDRANNRKLLQALAGRPAERRGARFVCALALALDGELRAASEGSVEGRILDAPRGPGGFGYDPLFYYAPFGGTFGEAPVAQKNRVSHRARALVALRPRIRELLAGAPPSPGAPR